MPSIYRRMAAWIYEGLLLFALCAITGLIFSLVTNSTNALTHHTALSVLLFFVIGAYFTWFWSKGQTLAMKTWRIKISDSMGNRPSKLRAASRYLLSWLWFLPSLVALALSDSIFETKLNNQQLYGTLAGWLAIYLLLAWMHPSKQFLHDRLAGTRLVSV